MSDTESFESVFELVQAFFVDYEWSWGNKICARLKAAHDREIRDTAQQQYYRGFRDGTHSMNAEHRVIAMRLRGLRFDGGSHENLSQIARAIWHNDFGWTQDACMGLRDELVRLMGGVSDENVHVVGLRCDDGCMGDVSNGEDTGRTHDSPSNRDRNHMAVRESVDTMIGDGDDACDSQCCGACSAGDGGDSGEQAEVSDDCVDCDILGPDARGHAAGCDFHELGVSDGGTADDSPADFRGRTGCDVVHMDGLVTYDVLDNERRKVIAKLRKIPDVPDSSYTYDEHLAMIYDALDVEAAPWSYSDLDEIRDNLIHLLGGDQPSGIDLLREMDGDGTSTNDDGTCPNDDPTPSITDELREWASDRHCKGISHTDVLNIGLIADRIDDQFGRICQQQEAVLQSIIDEVVEERKSDRLRIEKLERQRDHWRTIADTYSNAITEAIERIKSVGQE